MGQVNGLRSDGESGLDVVQNDKIFLGDIAPDEGGVWDVQVSKGGVHVSPPPE